MRLNYVRKQYPDLFKKLGKLYPSLSILPTTEMLFRDLNWELYKEAVQCIPWSDYKESNYALLTKLEQYMFRETDHAKILERLRSKKDICEVPFPVWDRVAKKFSIFYDIPLSELQFSVKYSDEHMDISNLVNPIELVDVLRALHAQCPKTEKAFNRYAMCGSSSIERQLLVRGTPGHNIYISPV